MGAALGWGALAASSLVIGALLAFARRWPDRQVGLVLAFGAGALIAAVSFELVQEGVDVGGGGWTALGLGLGAICYFLADRALGRREMLRRMRSGDDPRPNGTPLALGAFLDGIPEQLVLGIGIASGEGVSVALVVAIFVSNLPEAIGSATEMAQAGRRRETVIRLWIVVASICALASVLGYAIADPAGVHSRAVMDGFAAGALLVLLIDSMIPDATAKAGRVAGLVTTLGFAVAAGLSQVS
jgi:ZIP family zinc transporter